jgi:hypothetical protein
MTATGSALGGVARNGRAVAREAMPTVDWHPQLSAGSVQQAPVAATGVGSPQQAAGAGDGFSDACCSAGVVIDL